MATLGEQGFGSGGNFNPGGAGRRGTRGGGTTFRGPAPTDELHEILDWFFANLATVALVGIILIAVFIAVWLVVTWINSRGRFMFIEAVANNTYEVKAPWARYRELANSLFLFRVCLALTWTVLGLATVAVCLAIAWSDIMARQFESHAVAAIILGAILVLPLGLAFAIVEWCTSAFVAPIMYATCQTVLPAWNEFRTVVVPGHVGALILFLLMQFVLRIGIAIASVLIGCVTCCIGFLPYLSTVITLPLIVFDRCYSLYFLQQFDPRYAIIREPPPPAAFSVMTPGADQPPWPPGR